MSVYTTFKTPFDSQKEIVDALISLGIPQEHIELSKTDSNDIGINTYGGGLRKVCIAVRQQHIGTSYADLGFTKQENGQYVMGYDHSESWKITRHLGMDTRSSFKTVFANKYAENKVRKFAKRNGYRVVEKKVENNQVHLKLRSLRG